MPRSPFVMEGRCAVGSSTYTRHGNCKHGGFGPVVTREALECARINLVEMDFRQVVMHLQQGWKVIRRGVTFQVITVNEER